MCTAIYMNKNGHYFGRNLDLDHSYGEEVCVMPRCFALDFRKKEGITKHYAMIGMATVVNDIPLFYDAVNEHGLAMAGLNFPNNAYYNDIRSDKDNITPFEFIPWILGQCKSINEAKTMLESINLLNIPFSDNLPLSPLHWIISDNNLCIVVEQMKDGLHIYDNPVGVLTNNPPFEYQLTNYSKYSKLRCDNKSIIHIEEQDYSSYCQGLGAVGLPGDVSSMSRFVRAAFALDNSVCNNDEISCVSQFFHLLSYVEMTRGICLTDDMKHDVTVYSSCIDMEKGRYYYTTYDNRQITCVDMYKTNLDSEVISRYPLLIGQAIAYQN